MSRESALWGWLAKSRRHFKTALHINRVENPAGPGMPDVEGQLNPAFNGGQHCGQFWIELKAAERPKRAETPVRFKVRPKQVEWSRKRYAVGGRVYWLLQVGSGADAARYLLPGDVAALIQRGMSEIDLSFHAINSVFGRTFKPEDVVKLCTEQA